MTASEHKILKAQQQIKTHIIRTEKVRILLPKE